MLTALVIVKLVAEIALMALLLGQREDALRQFEAMDALDPDNAYALASRAQI